VIRPTLARERALWDKGYRFVAGVDEVGRGPLAGPVVVAAVILPPGCQAIEGLRDSKTLTLLQRERAAADVRAAALAWSVAAASVREIDRLNILRATALAMRRALARLPLRPDYVLIDGRPMPDLKVEHDAVIDGDAHCCSIAGAAVLAKCVRDRLMLLLGARYEGWGWEENKGYATAEHLAVLDRVGPTPHHRKSFAPVVQPRLL
jgi:ribonuclease HII